VLKGLLFNICSHFSRIIFVYFLLFSSAYGVQYPTSTPIDPRIKVIVYAPDDVFSYTGFYGYQAIMEFADDEVIDTISMGDTVAWQLVPSGKRLFIKPVEPEATTNMSIITNKRLYNFVLHAKDATNIDDPEMTFLLKFIYPDEGVGNVIQQFSTSGKPDFSEPGKYNFNYTISGDPSISPTQIFDDGEFTYFKFPKKNAEIPAFFIVHPNLREEMVNYHMRGDYVVVERVTARYTLRNGESIVCVFNEARPFHYSPVPPAEVFMWQEVDHDLGLDKLEKEAGKIYDEITGETGKTPPAPKAPASSGAASVSAPAAKGVAAKASQRVAPAASGASNKGASP